MADQSKKYKFDISNLNLHYGDFHALKDVNMQIEANKITAFIGPSGCGKSTFLKTLNRMNDLVENCKIDGKVLLDGTDIYKDMDEITLRYRVGMVFQQPNPFPKSVYDNVAYGPRIAGIKCAWTFRWTAAETLYRKNTCGRAGSHIDGRTNFCTGSDFNI